MLAGFTSRWMMPCSCACARPAGRDLTGECEGLVRRERASIVEALAQRLAVDEVHHEVRRVVPHAEIDDGDAVRMRELRHHAGLAIEAGLELVVGDERRVEELDRDELADGDALGLEDLAHRASGHHLEQLVAIVDDLAYSAVRGVVGHDG